MEGRGGPGCVEQVQRWITSGGSRRDTHFQNGHSNENKEHLLVNCSRNASAVQYNWDLLTSDPLS